MEQSIEYGQAGERSTATRFMMPAPTILPLLFAFGLLLTLAGVIFHHYLPMVGLIVVLYSAVGWWRKVIPSEEHAPIALDFRHRPQPVKAHRVSVEHLVIGPAAIGMRSEPGQNRRLIPEEAHPYSSGVLGGLGGGAVMALLACLYGLIAQHSIWFPINLLAGVVMPSLGSETVDQLRMFDGGAFAAALVGHAGLSILMGVLYAMILPMFPKGAPFWAGILMPLVWSGVIATLLNLINPALNGRISWPWFVACQLGFGLVCGYIVARSARIKTRQSWTFAERAGMHAPGAPQGGDDNITK